MNVLMHGHHTSLFSWGRKLEERTEEILRTKPVPEHPLRLALIQDVTDLLPHNEGWTPLNKAWVAYDKAWAALNKTQKAYGEAAQALNKAWTAFSKAQAPALKAWTAYGEAWTAYSKAMAGRNKTQQAYEKAQAAYQGSFDAEAFHRAYCLPNCPWDGATIFPKEA